MRTKPPAECLALIVCEGVIEDARTHNKTIINTFNEIYAAGFPAKQDRLTLFMSFTNGHNKMPLSVRVKRDGSDPIVKVDGELHFGSPLDVAEIVFDLRGVQFPGLGDYTVEVWLAGHLVRERRLTVKPMPKEEAK